MAENMKSIEEEKVTESDKELVSFVVEHCDRWRDWRDTNFQKKWDEYERLYYGIWSDEDKTRDSERSRIVTPAIREAVENKTAEMLEAMSGPHGFFDIRDDLADKQPVDVEQMKAQLKEDMTEDGYEKVIKEVARTAEVFGTACAEILVKTKIEKIPTTQQIPGSDMSAFGVEEKEVTSVPIKMIHPRNFLIDPNAEAIDEALGVAVEEYASLFKIVKGIEDGIYRKVNIEPMYDDTDLEPTATESIYQDDKVKILRYYGLVPREYLEQLENEGNEVVDLFPEDSEADQVSDLVEAIIVIANDQHLLKAEATPYMMGDRPIVSHRPETVPGRFWGIGTVEKGYNMQKAVDAQIRSHLDSLALTTAPMMAVDATKLPRGMKTTIQPGKTIMVNGNPAEVLQPFKFGQTDASNYETAKAFEAMLLKATGTLDSAELTRAAAGGQGAAGVGMSLAMSALVKKNKQALLNFQTDFIIPLVKKVAYRYMQFDPDRYPSKDFKFIPSGSIGMIAKEYEQQQFIGLLQTLGPESPIVPLLLTGIVQSSSLSNREQLLEQLQKMAQPSPEQQQAQQAQMQAQMQLLQAQVNELNSRAAESQANAQESQAKAQKALVEAQLMPEQTRAKVVQSIATNLPDNAENEFQRRAKVAELLLKEREIASKEKIVNKQMQN